MGLLKGSLPVCPRNVHCVRWAQIYMKYCLCSVKDGLSFALGLVSIISWGVAEVPQIITNYKEKTTEGLSMAFLTTWIIGDLFNLIGCKLEPATLPTQYYMALLYTVTTFILAAQTIYYGHIYPQLKANNSKPSNKGSKVQGDKLIENKKRGGLCDENFKFPDDRTDGSSGAGEKPCCISSPIPVLPRFGSHGKDIYFTSARSLSKSHPPSAGSYLSRSRENVRTLPISITSHNPVEEPLLGDPPLNTKSTLCVVSALTFFLSFCNLHHCMDERSSAVLRKPSQGVVIYVARKLLQSNAGLSLIQESYGSSHIGSFLGWAMAAIYMGGRLPQICLNIRRGNVEGLNPLMFIFALVGNTTYVASILVSSVDWSKIRPNLPWLADAGGCALLDSFILFQFLYFRYTKNKSSNDQEVTN